MKTELEKRFRYLWTWELMNSVIIFPAMLFLLGMTFDIGVYAWMVNAGVCLLLLSGAGFAFLRYRDLKYGTQMIKAYHWIFEWLRWVFPVLILGLGGMLLYAIPQMSTSEHIIAGLLYIFAILEYVNYFQFQLSYDNQADVRFLVQHKRLKRGMMAREFDW